MKYTIASHDAEFNPPPDAECILFMCGEQTGPFQPDQIRSMWKAGSITSDALFYYPQLQDWRPVKSFCQDSNAVGNANTSDDRQFFFSPKSIVWGVMLVLAVAAAAVAYHHHEVEAQKSRNEEAKEIFERMRHSEQPYMRKIMEEIDAAAAKEKAVQVATTSAESARRDATQKMYRELIKLNAATESGVTYDQYSERVLNAKTEIESAALNLEDDTVRQVCLQVLDAYQAANDFWSKFIGRSTSYPRFTYFEQERFKKYDIKFDSDGTAGKQNVSVIWRNAQGRLKLLGEYLKQRGLL